MSLPSARRVWPCLDGPLAGTRVTVSGLAAWTGVTEARGTVVQHTDGTAPRFATTDATGRLIVREGEIIIGHYGQRWPWERGFRFEPSELPEVYAELWRDHRTPDGVRRNASPASWQWLRGEERRRDTTPGRVA